MVLISLLKVYFIKKDTHTISLQNCPTISPSIFLPWLLENKLRKAVAS